MLGNKSAARIESASCVPLETSFFICMMASKYTTLPAAPAAESSASTSGTPAAKVVDKVRVNLATHDLSMSSPMTGILSESFSWPSLKAWDRLCICL